MKRKRLLNILALLMMAVTGAWAQEPATTYSVKMAEGTADADKWTVKVGTGEAQTLPVEGLSEGDALTLTYSGTKKVKSVTAVVETAGNTVDLSTLTGNYEAQDGDVLTGTLGGKYKITIANGASVTLDGVTINGVNQGSCSWAGITCLGNATIILADGSTNTVKGFYEEYPGIHVPSGSTLTIQGSGSLDASSNGQGAGIGGGWDIACGNIVITGGTITATGGDSAAGIGGGCYGACGYITIANTVTSVTANMGGDATNSIGEGDSGTCGTVTIGGNVTGNISTSPYIYQP